MRVPRVLIVLVIVLAGCAAVGPGPATDTDAPPVETVPATASPTPPTLTAGGTTAPPAPQTSSATATDTPAPTPAGLENPWGHDPVVVAVNDSAGGARDKYGVFREALAYWAAHDAEYAGVDVPFAFRPDAPDPDITIRYVKAIEDCGETESVTDPLGCAPYYRDQRPGRHTVVSIRENDDDVQLLATVKHELGHVLGIGHGEAPMPLMAANNLYLLASPWDPANVTYYVDYTDKPGFAAEEYDEEIEAALGYFAAGADGNLDPPHGFTRVDRRGEANVVLAFHDDPIPSSGEPGSRGEGIYRGDIQGTPYLRFTVAIYDLDPPVTSYHVAYWYAQVVIGEGESYPAILSPEDCDLDCRRGEWYR